ncbi:MAG TPA: DUF4197 domain-containing protein [Mariprofundaceae bacterium]|nr:DUF4197 domain-containing protein [Mariprofundaceae bacterium]
MRLRALAIALIATVPCSGTASAADWMDHVLSTIRQGTGHAEQATLSEREMAAGLRQALAKGVRRAVSDLGRVNGFWRRPGVEIPLPDNLQKPAALLHRVGLDRYAEDLHKRINRAAETAVPVARPIFRDAIASISFADARRILQGPDDAATRYFEQKTTAQLVHAFTPLVHRELERSGAVRSYRAFSARYASIPLIGERLKDNLDDYVTRQALKAMFSMLASEEADIRHHPAERTTALLRRVFR